MRVLKNVLHSKSVIISKQFKFTRKIKSWLQFGKICICCDARGIFMHGGNEYNFAVNDFIEKWNRVGRNTVGTIILKIYFYKKILTTVYIEMYLNTPIIFNNFYHNIFKCECLDVSHLKILYWASNWKFLLSSRICDKITGLKTTAIHTIYANLYTPDRFSPLLQSSF